MFEFHTHVLFFFVADVHILILYYCRSNSRFKSSLKLMFMLFVSPTQNKFSLVLSCIVGARINLVLSCFVLLVLYVT